MRLRNCSTFVNWWKESAMMRVHNFERYTALNRWEWLGDETRECCGFRHISGREMDPSDFYRDDLDYYWFEWIEDRTYGTYPVVLCIRDERPGPRSWWCDKPFRIVFMAFDSFAENIAAFLNCVCGAGGRGTMIDAACGLVQSRRRISGVRRYAIDLSKTPYESTRWNRRRRCFQYTKHQCISDPIPFDTIFVTVRQGWVTSQGGCTCCVYRSTLLVGV